MDILAFRYEFERLYRPLGMFALRYTGSVEDAEDVVQEAFIKAWSVVEANGEIDNFKSYIYRTVRNGCIDLLRSRREYVTIDEAAEVPIEEIDTSEIDARIWSAIDSLPPKCRKVFLMSKRDGLSGAEIADSLGVSLKTVKNQMTKALARLREELGENYLSLSVSLLSTLSVIG